MEFFPWVKIHTLHFTLRLFSRNLLSWYSTGLRGPGGRAGAGGEDPITGTEKRRPRGAKMQAGLGLSYKSAGNPENQRGSAHTSGPLAGKQAPHGSSHQGLVDQLRWGRRGRWMG